MRTCICVSLCLFSICVSPLHAQRTSAEDLLLANEKKFSDLQIQRKCDEAANFLAEDFQGTGGQSDSKSDFLQSCKSGEILWHSEQFSNVEFKLHTPTVAVISYRDDFDCTFQGRPAKGRLLVSSVWLKDGERWLMHLHTATTDPMVVTEGDKLRFLYLDTDDTRDESAKQNKVGGTTVAVSPPDSFFLNKEKEVWEALKHKDKAAAAPLLADDFVGLEDTGFSTKSEWLKQFDEQYSVDAYAIEDLKLFRPSPTTALLLYKSTCKGTGEWADLCSRPLYISDFWVERNGQWFDLFSQDTQATSGQPKGERPPPPGGQRQ